MKNKDDNDNSTDNGAKDSGANTNKSLADRASLRPDKPNHSAEELSSPSTKLSNNARENMDTEYTEYRTGDDSSGSLGFQRAKAIAIRALSEEKNILKKRFVLEELLGEGGMGIVYKARDLRKVEADDPFPFIAVKVLGQTFKDHPDAFVTLQQETTKSHRLAHPNIVTVHDFDRDGNTIYMTMELLDGKPLDQLLLEQQGRGLPRDQTLSIFNDICSALSYAHARNLIHADLKPSNIFISPEGAAKVLDFGIARAAYQDGQQQSFDAGSLGAHTPSYSTVEMVEGKPSTFSDDIYALGCIVYQMLAGYHPYNRKSAKVALEQKLPLKRIDSLNPNEWKALASALSLHREDRTETIDDFRSGMTVQARSPKWKWLASLLVIILIAGGWYGYDTYRAHNEKQQMIADKLQRAEQCFEAGDYACALEQSLSVSNLSPGHQQAKRLYSAADEAQQQQLLAAKSQVLLEEANACFAQDDLHCTKVKLEAIHHLTPDHKDAQILLERLDNILNQQRIEALVASGQACLEDEDINCALAALEEAQGIDATSTVVSDFATKVDALKTKREAARTERRNRVKRLLAKATNCLDEKRYRCVINESNKVLTIDSKNSRATDLKKTAITAQNTANQKKINTLIAQGEDCYGLEDYYCAVDKAKAALAIQAKNTQALALIKKSKQKNKLRTLPDVVTIPSYDLRIDKSVVKPGQPVAFSTIVTILPSKYLESIRIKERLLIYDGSTDGRLLKSSTNPVNGRKEQAGEFSNTHSFVLPADMPAGLYTIELQLLVNNEKIGSKNNTLRLTMNVDQTGTVNLSPG